MSARYFVFISLLILPFMSRSQQPKGDSVKTFIVQEIQDIAEEPTAPPNIKSKFKTLEDWFYNICDNDKPKKSIDKFNVNISFSEPSGDIVIFLFGVNTYDEGKNRTVTRIDFEPSNMYFKLPKKEYKSLNRAQLKDKLTSQLKEFTKTEKFKTSYLTKSNAIVMEFSGEAIWTK